MSEIFNEGSVSNVELETLAKNYMMLYGLNINAWRAIPRLQDGLKLVQRRILFQLYKYYRNTKVKEATLIGDVLKLHPHGDGSLGSTIPKMCQDFTNNVPLIEATGNAGTPVSGNDFAAPRYLNVKIAKFTLDVLFDEFDGKVNMTPSYDNSHYEPIVLPAKFPVILLNGITGIGYTMSSDIPPYNLTEVANATIKLLKNPDANIKLVPDSPTGCDILVKDDDTFIMQSSFDVDNLNYSITIRNTPYMKFLEKIDKDLRIIQDSNNPIKNIISADDESILDEGIFKYVIRCKPCNLYDTINILFKRISDFRSCISTKNMVVVDSKFRPRQYNVRQILCDWIKTRLSDKRAWLLRELVTKTSEHNMLEGKAFMLSPENLNKTIKIFRSCHSKAEIVPALVQGYENKVTSSQANNVSELKMYQLTHDEYDRTLKKIEEVFDEIEYIKSVVNSPDKIKELIIDEIKTIKNKYGSPRRSKILNIGKSETVNIGVVQILTDGSVLFSETENPEHLSSDVTPISGENVCLIDDQANFLWVDTNKVPHDKAIALTSIGKTIMGKCVSAVSNMSNDIIILTNHGRIKYIPINKIPTNSSKKPLVPLDSDEYVVSVMETPDTSLDILIYTNDGLGKRIQTSELNKVTSLNASGQFILKGYNVSGVFCINSKPYLVYVTKLGKLRVNHSKFLTATKKFAEPKQIIKLSPQDDLIAVFCVDKDQSITLKHADGRVSTINIDSLPISTMSIPPERPKHVPGVKVVRATLS